MVKKYLSEFIMFSKKPFSHYKKYMPYNSKKSHTFLLLTKLYNKDKKQTIKYFTDHEKYMKIKNENYSFSLFFYF